MLVKCEISKQSFNTDQSKPGISCTQLFSCRACELCRGQHPESTPLAVSASKGGMPTRVRPSQVCFQNRQ